jgi:hypothetical protein
MPKHVTQLETQTVWSNKDAFVLRLILICLSLYIFLSCKNNDLGPLAVTILTLNLLTTTIVAPPSNASKWRLKG